MKSVLIAFIFCASAAFVATKVVGCAEKVRQNSDEDIVYYIPESRVSEAAKLYAAEKAAHPLSDSDYIKRHILDIYAVPISRGQLRAMKVSEIPSFEGAASEKKAF